MCMSFPRTGCNLSTGFLRHTVCFFIWCTTEFSSWKIPIHKAFTHLYQTPSLGFSSYTQGTRAHVEQCTCQGKWSKSRVFHGIRRFTAYVCKQCGNQRLYSINGDGLSFKSTHEKPISWVRWLYCECLKEHCHEIFRLRFSSSNNFCWYQWACPETISNFFEYSWSYSYS